MKQLRRIVLTIFVSAIFFGGAYFVGNFALGTFDAEIRRQLVACLLGVLLWCFVAIIVGVIYKLVEDI